MKPLKTFRLKDPKNELRWWTEKHGDYILFCFETYMVAGALMGPQAYIRKTVLGRICG